MAPLQKRAWIGLVIGALFAVAFFMVFFFMGGIDTFDEDVNFRLTIDFLGIAALVASLVIVNIPLIRRNMTDERDLKIASYAPYIQWLAVIFSMVAWTIGLTEYYHETGLVPAVFLYIMIISVLIISAIAQSLGILIGYWKADQ